MDGSGALLARLRAALATYDDDALAALSSKGLVRRARKDLETIRPKILESADDAARIYVEAGDAVAELDMPPANSRCGCPASGICRHILAALIFVKETATENPARAAEGKLDAVVAPSVLAEADREVLALDDEAIARWAGKALVARSKKALALGMPVEFDNSDRLIARLPTRNVACRWMPGCGPEGMVCSCHAQGVCEHRVAAVLAFQAARGARVLDDPSTVSLASAPGAPRSRDEVLVSVGSVVSELVVLGLSRLSRASAERLRTLAVSAHGVDLPRLEGLLRGLASQVELALTRDAQADSARLMAQAARVEALRHGLARRLAPHLVGQHKTSYQPVGDIDLVSLGAQAWRSQTGYAGLTLYFWDRSAGNWATWTDTRPLSVGQFDPVARYRDWGPWEGLASPEQSSRKTLRLTGAWRNPQGRLSGRPATRATTIGPAEVADVPARLDEWNPLVGKARRLFGGGFHDRTEQDEIVLLAPDRWGPAIFDEVRQVLIRIVWDKHGCPLPLVLRHQTETAAAVMTLSEHDPSATRAVLGILRFGADQLCVEPIALHTVEKVINLTLEGAEASSTPDSAAPPVDSSEDDEEAEADRELNPSGSNLGRLLGLLATQLLYLGEGGLASFRAIPELRALGASAEALGLSSCGTAVGRLVRPAGSPAARRAERTTPGRSRAAFSLPRSAAVAGPGGDRGGDRRAYACRSTSALSRPVRSIRRLTRDPGQIAHDLGEDNGRHIAERNQANIGVVSGRVINIAANSHAATAHESKILKRDALVHADPDVKALDAQERLDPCAGEDLAIGVDATAVVHRSAGPAQLLGAAAEGHGVETRPTVSLTDLLRSLVVLHVDHRADRAGRTGR